MAMSVTYTNFCGRIIAENRGGVQRAYQRDTLGNTVALLDNTQTATDTWEYWPFGEVVNRTGSNPTPFAFVGTLGYYTGILGMLYVRARSWFTSISIWSSVDRYWPYADPYTYCDGSPLNFVDLLGTMPCGGQADKGVSFTSSRCVPNSNRRVLIGSECPQQIISDVCKYCNALVSCWGKVVCGANMIQCWIKSGSASLQAAVAIENMVQLCNGVSEWHVGCGAALCNQSGLCGETEPAGVLTTCGTVFCPIFWSGGTQCPSANIFYHELSHCAGSRDLQPPDAYKIGPCLANLLGVS